MRTNNYYYICGTLVSLAIKMAPTPFPEPKGSSGGGGRGGGRGRGLGGGGGGGAPLELTPGQTAAIVLSIIFGPVVLYILWDTIRGAIRVYIRRKVPQQHQSGVGTTMPAIPLTIAPVPAAQLPAVVPAITNDAIITYWGTPRTN